MKKETSCINSRAILDYAKQHNVEDLSFLVKDLDFEINELSDPEYYLRDPNNWISCKIIAKLYERSKVFFNDEMIAYKIAKYTIENTALGYAQRIVIKSFWSYKRALRNVQKLNDKWNRNKKVELVSVDSNSAVIRLHWNPDMDSSKDICLYNRGAYTFFPAVWGGKPLDVRETCCYFEGAKYCEYHLKFPARNKWYEIFSRFFTSRSVLEETIAEMEADKRVIEEKYEEVNRLNEELREQMEELKQSKELLSRADKLSYLGNMAARLAHEIKNPLWAIQTFIRMVPENFHDKDFMGSYYDIALEETNRVNNLIMELLDLVKTKETKFELNDIHDLINKMVLLVSPQSKEKDIRIKTIFDPDIKKIRLDSEKIKQVILNILVNGIEAVQERGLIRIKTRWHNGTANSNKVSVEIKDNGKGIPLEKINNIFDPYCTTKHKSDMHSGVGLGLFISHKNMEDHGGSIEVKSTVGKGTSFIMKLPVN